MSEMYLNLKVILNNKKYNKKVNISCSQTEVYPQRKLNDGTIVFQWLLVNYISLLFIEFMF